MLGGKFQFRPANKSRESMCDAYAVIWSGPLPLAQFVTQLAIEQCADPQFDQAIRHPKSRGCKRRAPQSPSLRASPSLSVT